MPDYKTMYQKIYKATTRAIQLLQDAQQDTEELYLNDSDTPILWPSEDVQVNSKENGSLKE